METLYNLDEDSLSKGEYFVAKYDSDKGQRALATHTDGKCGVLLVWCIVSVVYCYCGVLLVC